MAKIQIFRRRPTYFALILTGGLVVWFSSANRYRDGWLDAAFWLAVVGWVTLALGVLGLLLATRGVRDNGPPAA